MLWLHTWTPPPNQASKRERKRKVGNKYDKPPPRPKMESRQSSKHASVGTKTELTQIQSSLNPNSKPFPLGVTPNRDGPLLLAGNALLLFHANSELPISQPPTLSTSSVTHRSLFTVPHWVCDPKEIGLHSTKYILWFCLAFYVRPYNVNVTSNSGQFTHNF